MKRFLHITFPCFLALSLISCDLESILEGTGSGGPDGLTRTEVVSGLKTALEVGIDTAASRLHLPQGYWANQAVKILLPQEVETAFAKAEQLDNAIGNVSPLLQAGIYALFDFDNFQALRSDLWRGLNNAAEAAAPLSVPIFVNAITSMTIDDAMGILRGDTTAATDYLENRTTSALTATYSPFVDSALDVVNANVLWESVSTRYNTLVGLYQGNTLFQQVQSSTGQDLSLDSLTTDLARYTTTKALNGLFWAVGQEEARIRENPLARVNAILKKVFGWLDERQDDPGIS